MSEQAKKSKASDILPQSAILKEPLVGPGDLEEEGVVFAQIAWIPQGQVARHKHTGMNEFIRFLEGPDDAKLEVILQASPDSLPDVRTLAQGDYCLVRENILHTTRNGNAGVIKVFAMGVKTRSTGKTVVE